MTVYTDIVSAPVRLAELLQADTIISLADIVHTSAYIDVTYTQLIALADTFAVVDTIASTPGVIILDRFNFTDALTGNQLLHLALADGVTLTDLIAAGKLVVITDTLTVVDALAIKLVLTIADKLGLTATLAGAAKYQWSFAETVRLAEELTRFTGASIADTLNLVDALGNQLRALRTVNETLVLAETVTPALLLRVTVADHVSISHTQALKALLQGTLHDTIELSGAFLLGDGSFTTWTMNTRTAAVTEYSDYVFNSFAQIGDRYVGATNQGLYWLDGDTDTGEDIVARMRGGYLQFGGTHLSRLKAAYIATRNDSEFVLRIETGDGALYNYAVNTRSMRSTKVHMGKGQRARYFTYELISTGDDFDLETLEFVPITVDRRV